MKTLTTISSLLLGLSFLGSIGCDRLPESITGRPDPAAARIAPVGPTGARLESEKMVAIDSATNSESGPRNEAAPSPFAALSNRSIPANDLLLVAQTNPSTGLEALTSAYSNESAGNGLQVPAAGSPSADGKIYIDSAHLKFVNDLEVAAQADGLITRLDAEEGDLLRANDLMIQLDDRLANSELAVTQKEYEAALEKSKDDSEILYSKAANDVAREEYNIALEIDKKGAGTATELSKKWLEYRRAGLAITVAEVKNKQDVLAVGVSEAKQGAAKVQVDMRKIVAPFEGVVAEKRKERHDWVRAGDVILRLVSMEQLRVVGQVRVSQLSAAPHELLGSPARIEIELFPGKVQTVMAKVGFVSPVMESSQSYRIWLQIPNIKSNAQWVFREGMPAKIEISTR